MRADTKKILCHLINLGAIRIIVSNNNELYLQLQYFLKKQLAY